MIDKNSKSPIYYQIEEWVKAQIENNTFKIDKLIPSEREFIERLGVSRHTVRQAIGNLVNQGYLYRIPGKGTFVKDRNLIIKENRYTSFSEDMAYIGKNLVNEVLSLEYQEASKSIANRLTIDEKNPVIKVRRIRKVDQLPLAYEMVFISQKIVPELPEEKARTSLLQFYEQEKDLKIGYASETVEAVLVTEKTAELLGLPLFSPLLLVRTKLFLDNGQQVHYMKSYFRGNKYKFSLKLHR
ncbi:GntR family transcriptional regulator [Heliorestis convoluta]|uniref:GntR family transcriptional regulator n=1 Tax=Heliorestis convoluta TaxID=356322 RepID=A0A5Q2MVP1_9FIRM|nr:GntR family transcriptional regulator [Heliorestis convoluta]QGG46238.1 GntR family transcriptional regulator [Heliorestis convoluta]